MLILLSENGPLRAGEVILEHHEMHIGCETVNLTRRCGQFAKLCRK